MQDGICIRLYDQEDYEKRPRFTQPEIQRANLAEVILRMKAFRLGEIETFPFLEPPLAASVRAGYALLHELGALDDAHAFTPLGHELARLPLDPTLGRMLLQAREEKALPEVLVIAAGLSVPDPRERPEDAKEAAATAHRAFADADSDFLSLLHIWQADPREPEPQRPAPFRQGQLPFANPPARVARHPPATRRGDARRRPPQRPPPVDDTDFSDPVALRRVHRSILTGLLGQIAQRKERNLYTATGNRARDRFSRLRPLRAPGKTPQGRAAPRHNRDRRRKNQPAAVDRRRGDRADLAAFRAHASRTSTPNGSSELGAHLCRFSYADPHWNEKSGRVLAWERVLLSGLEVVRRRVDYGRIDAAKATELFIRGALVAGEAHVEHRFFKHNRELARTHRSRPDPRARPARG